MPDVFLLSGRTSLPTFEHPERALAVAPDVAAGAATPAAGREAALARLHASREALGGARLVLDALEERLRLRPVLPEPQSLQELARAARRRLSKERQASTRTVLDGRRLALDTLAAALEP